MKEEVEALLQGQGAGQELEDVPMDGFVRGTARYMLQVAIEAEATAFLGRGHYRRGDRTRVGWRNGYEPKAVQTEAGLLKFAVPQLRATAEPFRPQLPERLATRTPDLEALVRGMYVRGLSTQDIGALCGEAFGETRLSKSTVSRITEDHHRRIRTTNLIERLNGESRRRTKVIPRFPTERSCLSLLSASMIAASKQWRGIPDRDNPPTASIASCGDRCTKKGGRGRVKKRVEATNALCAFTGILGLDLHER